MNLQRTRRAMSDLEDHVLDYLDSRYPIVVTTKDVEAHVPDELWPVKGQQVYLALQCLAGRGLVRRFKAPGDRCVQWCVALPPKVRVEAYRAMVEKIAARS